MGRRLLVAFILATLLTGVVSADRGRTVYTYVSSSQTGRHYFRMKASGEGTLFRVEEQEADTVLWSTQGWYSPRVHLCEVGPECVVIRVGERPQGSRPNANDLAVAFYKNGTLLKSYSTADLIADGKAVVPSASHYSFYNTGSDRVSYELKGPSEYAWLFRIQTVDEAVHMFDPDTGAVIPTK